MAMSPREVWELFRGWATGKLSPDTLRNYERLVLRWLATLPSVPAEELKAFHLLSWGKTWHELQAVKRVWHWAAVVAELVPRNPFAGLQLPPIGQRHRVLTRPEMCRLLLGSRRDFRLYLLGLWHTMARPQEVRAFRWDQLRWVGYPAGMVTALRSGEACFVLREFKARRRRRDTHAPRIIPVPAALGQILAHRAEGVTDLGGAVFTTAAGSHWTKEAIRLRMKRLRRRVGLGDDDTGEPVVCYSIRHTAATEAAGAGVRDRLLADLMGHTTTRTTARYQHLQLEHLTAASRFLASARKNGRPGSRRRHDLAG